MIVSDEWFNDGEPIEPSFNSLFKGFSWLLNLLVDVLKVKMATKDFICRINWFVEYILGELDEMGKDKSEESHSSVACSGDGGGCSNNRRDY